MLNTQTPTQKQTSNNYDIPSTLRFVPSVEKKQEMNNQANKKRKKETEK